MSKQLGTQFAALFAENRFRISQILNDPKMKGRDKQIALFGYVLAAETQSGSSFLVTRHDESPYLALGLTNEIVYLPKHGRGADYLFAYVQARYGLGEREPNTKFVYDSLRNHVFQVGARVELRRFSAYRKDLNALYISNYDGFAWKIDGDQVRKVRNGDGVFFADDDRGETCLDVEIADHNVLLQRLTDLNFCEVSPGGMTADQQKMAITVWLFALAFPDMMPTKPLLMLEGAAGSGKSSAAQLIQLALMGAKKPMILQKNKEDDFGVILLRSPIAVFDNTDSYIEWVPDAICSYTTSGMWTKRKFYTDSEEIVIKPHAFIAVASKNPASFRREDVADRCILIRLERRSTFTNQARLEDEVASLRGKLLGEYLYHLNRIVAILADPSQIPQSDDDSALRMADFSLMARLVGKVLSWGDADITDMLLALQSERDAFINEDDPLVEILTDWLAYRVGGRYNIGRVVTLSELFADLEGMAQATQKPFYKSAKILAQKMRSPHIESEFIVIANNVKGRRTYQMWRRTDPRLSVVDADSNDSDDGSSFNEPILSEPKEIKLTLVDTKKKDTTER